MIKSTKDINQTHDPLKIQNKNPENIQELHSSQSQNYCCRICLQEMSQAQIFNSCQCKGSNGYIHQPCLLQWIKKAKRHRDSFRTYYYICQICKSRIFLQVESKCRCLTFQQAKQQLFDKNICCTVTTIVFLFFAFLVLGIILYVSSMATNKAQTIVYSLGLSLTILTILIAIGIYIFNFVLKIETITIGIDSMHKKQRKNGRSNQIVPSENDVPKDKINRHDSILPLNMNLVQSRDIHSINGTVDISLSQLVERANHNIIST